ncbi:MAG: dTDP-4-dehydrorhamnose reductase [Methanolinea sp.]|nr:dTDP-4-dehydrorhamnose reductase [Methanolinea sp.]
MKILITGAKGQLGQDIQKECGNRGIPFIAADSRALDITDSTQVRAFIRQNAPDMIINCAAYNAVDQAETEWQRAFQVNGLGVRNLALAAREAGAIVVHYSTDYIFDGRKTVPYTIADPPNPLSMYGQSKYLGEQMIRDLADRFFLIRTSWVFGAGNMNFARKILEWSRGQDILRVVDDQVSVPTYTRDLARATLDLATTGEYGLYHITNSGSCSRYGWAELILGTIGWKGTLITAKSGDFPTPARRPSYSVLDNFGSREVIGHDLPPWETATLEFLNEMKVTL